MADKIERMQEIVNRGLIDRLPQEKQVIINELIKRGTLTQLSPQVNTQPVAVDPDVPTAENLAQQPAQQPQEESSIGDYAAGLGETALTLGTGATTGTVGFIGGFLEGVYDQAFGEGTHEDTLKKASEGAARYTYTPKTKEGQDLAKGLADVAGALPPVLGSAPLSSMKAPVGAITSSKIKDVSEVIKTLNPQQTPATISKMQDVLPASIVKSPKAKRALIAEQLRTNSPNVDAVTKTLAEDGSLITNKTAKRAYNVLSKDVGDVDANKIVSTVENMNAKTKTETAKMLKIVERGRGSGTYGDLNRPSDVVGEAVANMAKDIFKLNEKASNQIGNIAKSVKENVDITQPANKFMNQLSEMGVTFSRGDDGWIRPDFSRSKFMGGSQKDMTVLVNDIMNGTPSFETAHKLKQQIRKNIDFDAIGSNKLDRDSQNVLKDLSSGINDILREASPRYAKANAKFAETVDLKNAFDKMAGKDVDIFGDLSDKGVRNKGKILNF